MSKPKNHHLTKCPECGAFVRLLPIPDAHFCASSPPPPSRTQETREGNWCICEDCAPTPSSPETPADFRQLVRSALPNASCHGMEEEIDADFWATVARDEQGFVRTQDEWETLAAYARDLASRLERLKAEQISPTQAGWLLKHAHIVATWPELAESLRRLQSRGTDA